MITTTEKYMTNNSDKNFLIGISLSLIIHILFFIIIPYSPPQGSQKLYKFSEVEVSKVAFEEVKEKVEPEIKVVNKKQAIDIRDKNKVTPVESKQVGKLMIPENKGYQLTSPRFGVNLPAQVSVGDDFQVKIKNDKGAPTDVPFGEPDVAAHDLVEDTNLFNNRDGVYRPGIEDGKDVPNIGDEKGHYTKFKEKYVAPLEQKPRKEIVKEEPLKERKVFSEEGTIGDREVLYKPKNPEVELDKDIEVEIKFYVLPNGQVREAMPIIKGDTRLESVAIQYIKSWIFATLPKDVEQVEQWGKIKIKFKRKNNGKK